MSSNPLQHCGRGIRATSGCTVPNLGRAHCSLPLRRSRGPRWRWWGHHYTSTNTNTIWLKLAEHAILTERRDWFAAASVVSRRRGARPFRTTYPLHKSAAAESGGCCGFANRELEVDPGVSSMAR
ncbi:unnamed protein product [Danaus chrysippus]|uniref:(African queen) hypothetical protein n=1 Tax=Danaus chrysippus TaxID=151541 RepID=A0A8J2QSJ9_9NEOP|nr:unnamed protein product [Danaus chrysippus]